MFAYSNRAGDERALVVYHNKCADTRGWMRSSVAWAVKHGEERELRQSTLADGLALESGDRWFSIFRDVASGLEFIRSNRALTDQGLYVELGAYRRHVFIDFREVRDDQGQYANLAAYLGGRGVPSIDEALRETFLQPLHQAFKELVNADVLQRLASAAAGRGKARDTHAALLDEVEAKAHRVAAEVKRVAGGDGDERRVAAEVRRTVAAALRIAGGDGLPATLPAPTRDDLAARWKALLASDGMAKPTFLAWTLTRSLGAVSSGNEAAQRSRSGIDQWLLSRILERAFTDLGADEGGARHAVTLLKVLVANQMWHDGLAAGGEVTGKRLEAWLADAEVRQLLQVNRYRDVLWFNKEAAEQLLDWLLAVAAAVVAAAETPDPAADAVRLAACAALVDRLRAAGEMAGFQVERLLALAAADATTPAGRSG